jgi:two-component system response regulator HydG
MIDITSLGMFLDGLEEGVLFLDGGLCITAANKAAEQMLGNDAGSLLNHFCPTIFSGTHCAVECKGTASCTLVPKSGNDKAIQDIELKRPTGASLFLRIWALRLPTDNPDLYFAIIMRDRSHEVELEQEVRQRLRLGGMVGHSPSMQKLYEQILRAASSNATVLVSGESGTGKELVARALHDNSPRAAGPYVPVHCASLPEALLESELFGHAKGAFTGATAARLGRFEAAHGGTLLLDEIGEISPNIQVKLLRVLQEREVVRLGENHARHVDVRVITATHRDLASMVARGEFREDLYYRLRVLPLEVPALRMRKEDIPLLANKLLGDLMEQYQYGNLKLAQETILALGKYDWPGNIRQLSNALEYAVVHADGVMILPHHLPPEVRETKSTAHRIVPIIPTATSTASLVRPYYQPANHPEDEMAIIQRALAESGGNKTEAARCLGMSRTTLWKKLRQAGYAENNEVDAE